MQKRIADKKISQKIIVASIILISAVYYTIGARTGVDFDAFLNASAHLKLHHNIYAPPFIRDLQYYYSPLFAALLTPFSSFSFLVAEFLWLLVSGYWVYRIWFLCEAYFNENVLVKKYHRWWIILSVFLSLRFILDNFTQAQMSIFLLWATLESLKLFSEKKPLRGAALLALAMNIKLLPLIFLPYLFYRGKIKEGILVILFFVIYLYLPSIFIGWHYNAFLLQEWWAIINPLNPEHYIEVTNGPHSLDAMLSVYITDTTGEMDIKRNFINVSFENIFLIVNITRAFLIILTFAFLRTLPFKKANSRLHTFWEMSYLFLLTPILFPHILIYTFIYICPMLVYLLYYFIVSLQLQRPVNKLVLCSFVLISIIFTPIIGTDVIGKYAFHFLQHFRVLTIMTLLLIPIALLCRPEHISSPQSKILAQKV